MSMSDTQMDDDLAMLSSTPSSDDDDDSCYDSGGTGSGSHETEVEQQVQDKGFANGGHDEIDSGSETDTVANDVDEDRDEQLGSQHNSAMDADEDPENLENSPRDTAPTQVDSPDHLSAAVAEQNPRNGELPLNQQVPSFSLSSGAGGAHDGNDGSGRGGDDDLPGEAQVTALSRLRAASLSSSERQHKVARRSSSPRPTVQGNSAFLGSKDDLASSSAALETTTVTSHDHGPSPSKRGATSSRGVAWIQAARAGGDGGSAGTDRDGADEESHHTQSTSPSQSILALGVPPNRRTSSGVAVMSNDRSNSERWDVRGSVPKRRGSAEDRIGEKHREEQTKGGEGEPRAGADNLMDTQQLRNNDDVSQLENVHPRQLTDNMMDTQELLENEDVSQLEKIHPEQQRRQDERIERIVRQAVPGGRAAKQRATTRIEWLASSHGIECPGASSDDIFLFHSDEDDDDGRVAQSPAKRKRDSVGSARGGGKKKVAKGGGAQPSSCANTGARVNSVGGIKSSSATRRKSRTGAVRRVAAKATPVAVEDHRFHSNDRKPRVSPAEAAQLVTIATEAIRKSHVIFGSGAGSRRGGNVAADGDGADEAMDTAGAENGDAGDVFTPSRLAAAAETPATATVQPVASSASRPPRRRTPVRAAVTGAAAAVASPVQATETAAVAPREERVSWPLLWSFLRDEEGWSSAAGEGVLNFTYTMPAQGEGHPARTFTTTPEATNYVKGISDLLARFRVYEARGKAEKSGVGGGSVVRGRSSSRRNASRFRATRNGGGAGVGVAAPNEADANTDEVRGNVSRDVNRASNCGRSVPQNSDSSAPQMTASFGGSSPEGRAISFSEADAIADKENRDAPGNGNNDSEKDADAPRKKDVSADGTSNEVHRDDNDDNARGGDGPRKNDARAGVSQGTGEQPNGPGATEEVRTSTETPLSDAERWAKAKVIMNREGWTCVNGKGLVQNMWLKKGVKKKTAAWGTNCFLSELEVLRHLGLAPAEKVPSPDLGEARIEPWALSKHRGIRPRRNSAGNAQPAKMETQVVNRPKERPCEQPQKKTRDGSKIKRTPRKQQAKPRKKRVGALAKAQPAAEVEAENTHGEGIDRDLIESDDIIHNPLQSDDDGHAKHETQGQHELHLASAEAKAQDGSKTEDGSKTKRTARKQQAKPRKKRGGALAKAAPPSEVEAKSTHGEDVNGEFGEPDDIMHNLPQSDGDGHAKHKTQGQHELQLAFAETRAQDGSETKDGSKTKRTTRKQQAKSRKKRGGALTKAAPPSEVEAKSTQSEDVNREELRETKDTIHNLPQSDGDGHAERGTQGQHELQLLSAQRKAQDAPKTKRTARNQQAKPRKKRGEVLAQEAAPLEVEATRTQGEDVNGGKLRKPNDIIHNLPQSDDDGHAEHETQGQHELQLAMSVAQFQGRGAVAISPPDAPAHLSPYVPAGDTRYYRDRGGGTSPRIPSEKSGGDDASRDGDGVEGGGHSTNAIVLGTALNPRGLLTASSGPLSGMGVILTGLRSDTCDLVAALGGTVIVFPPKKGANHLDWFSDGVGAGGAGDAGSSGAVTLKVDRRRVLAVAAPESYRTCKFAFAVAAGVDIVHVKYLDHIKGSRPYSPADTANYLLPIGRSALINRELIIPHSSNFGRRQGSEPVYGGGGSHGDVCSAGGRPFQGKNVLLLLGERQRPPPSWEMILWVAGARVATIDKDGDHLGGSLSDIRVLDKVQYVKDRMVDYHFFINLDENVTNETRKRPAMELPWAAHKAGVRQGSMEWAAQCIAHGRDLPSDRDTCPWFCVEKVSLSGAAPGGVEGTARNSAEENVFYCLTTGGRMRYVAGDYVFVHKPHGATKVVARLESFERTNDRVTAVVTEMKEQSGNMLSDGGVTQRVEEAWLGRKVVLIADSTFGALYNNSDPSVFCKFVEADE